MNICVIPARGGSKRILKKNIKLFNGKPIIAYSIEAAIQSNCFDKIIVSTDDEEIQSVAIACGAESPFLRPKELSDDITGTVSVTAHAVHWVEQNIGSVTNVCCIYATAPFLSAKTVVDVYDKLIKSNKDYCFSVTSYAYPIQRAIYLKGDMVEKLNALHKVNYSQRYWEVFIGVWLYYFIHTIYDRYLSIKALKNYSIEKTYILLQDMH